MDTFQNPSAMNAGASVLQGAQEGRQIAEQRSQRQFENSLKLQENVNNTVRVSIDSLKNQVEAARYGIDPQAIKNFGLSAQAQKQMEHMNETFQQSNMVPQGNQPMAPEGISAEGLGGVYTEQQQKAADYKKAMDVEAKGQAGALKREREQRTSAEKIAGIHETGAENRENARITREGLKENREDTKYQYGVARTEVQQSYKNYSTAKKWAEDEYRKWYDNYSAKNNFAKPTSKMISDIQGRLGKIVSDASDEYDKKKTHADSLMKKIIPNSASEFPEIKNPRNDENVNTVPSLLTKPENVSDRYTPSINLNMPNVSEMPTNKTAQLTQIPSNEQEPPHERLQKAQSQNKPGISEDAKLTQQSFDDYINGKIDMYQLPTNTDRETRIKATLFKLEEYVKLGNLTRSEADYISSKYKDTEKMENKFKLSRM